LFSVAGLEAEVCWLGAFGVWIEATPACEVIAGGSASLTRLPASSRDLVIFIACSLATTIVRSLVWSSTAADHFAVSRRNIRSGRVYTLATTLFVHVDLLQLLFNALWCSQLVGPVSELGFRPAVVFVLGGVCGNAASLFLRARQRYTVGGTSGFYSLLALLAVMDKHRQHSPGLPFVARWGELTGGEVLMAYMCFDVACAVLSASGAEVDLVARAGGAATGWALGTLSLRH